MKLDTIVKAAFTTMGIAVFAGIVLSVANGHSGGPESFLAAGAVCVIAFFVLCLIYEE